jgi:CO dehydrogenase nickel-insertion accessory protein CooC1
MTAARIRDLAKDMQVSVRQTGLIINRVANGEVPESLVEQAKGYGLDIFGAIPLDEQVVEYTLKRIPTVELPDSSPVVKAIDAILDEYVDKI